MSKKKEIVCVKNNVLHLDYSQFTATELKVWFTFLAQVRDMGEEEILISHEEFAELADLPKSTPSYVVPIATEMAKRIQSATVLERKDENSGELVWFFRKFEYSLSKIDFAVNKEYVAWVNDILNNFTKFSLSEFVPLKTKAAQVVYLAIKENLYKNQGVVYVSIEELKRKLGIDKYRNNDVTAKIVKPAVEEICRKNAFGDSIEFRIIKEGKSTKGYEFAMRGRLDEIDRLNASWEESSEQQEAEVEDVPF